MGAIVPLAWILAGCPAASTPPAVSHPPFLPTSTVPSQEYLVESFDMQVKQKVPEIVQQLPEGDIYNKIIKSVYAGAHYPEFDSIIPDIFHLPLPVGIDTKIAFASFSFGNLILGDKPMNTVIRNKIIDNKNIVQMESYIQFSPAWLSAPPNVQRLLMAKEASTIFIWPMFREKALAAFQQQGGNINTDPNNPPTQHEREDVLAIEAYEIASGVPRIDLDYAGYLAVVNLVDAMSASEKEYLRTHTNIMYVYEQMQKNNIPTNVSLLVTNSQDKLVLNPTFAQMAFEKGAWTDMLQNLPPEMRVKAN